MATPPAPVHTHRCNSTALAQYHKWAICFKQVVHRQQKYNLKYTWLLRTRTDVWWHHTLDSKLRLPALQQAAVRTSHKRVIFVGRPTAASDWFTFVAGVHVESFLGLPNSPCEWADGDSRGVFDQFIERNFFRKMPLGENCDKGSWPWPIEILRDKSALSILSACKRVANRTGVNPCTRLSRGEVLALATVAHSTTDSRRHAGLHME